MAQPAFIFRAHTSPVNCARFFGDDRLMVSGDQSGQLIIWNMLLKRPLVNFTGAHGGSILAVCGINDSTVISQGRDNKLHIWRLNAGEFYATLDIATTLAIDSMSFCKFSHIQHQGATWIAGLEQAGEGKAFLYNLATETKIVADVGRRSHTDAGAREDSPMCLKLVPVDGDGDTLGLVVGYESTTLQLFAVNVSKDQHPAVLKSTQETAHSEPIMSIDYDSDGKTVYTCSADSKICRYAISSAGFQVAQEPGTVKHSGLAEIRCFSLPKLVAAAGWDYALHLFDTDLKPYREIRFHRAALTSVDVSTLAKGSTESISSEMAKARWNERPQWLVVASQDHRISLWNLQDIL